MVGYLPHCTFNLNPRAASIDTPLHAYVPRAHVDHMHADAIIAIAASANSQELTEKIFGDEIGWLPWKRPGYELGLWLEKFCRENPQAKGVRAREPRPLHLGRRRQGLLRDHARRSSTGRSTGSTSETAGKPAFGGAAARAAAAPPSARRIAARADAGDPRHDLARTRAMVGHFDDQRGGAGVRRRRATSAPLAALGTSCPDHFLRTKIRPLVVDFDPAEPDVDATLAGLPAAIEAYRAGLRRLLRALQASRQPGDARPERGRLPRPRRRHDHLRRDKATARIAGEFYVNAINVMRGAVSGLRVPRPAGAGSLRHRILAARRSQAAAHAEAEEPRRPRSRWSPAAPAASARPPRERLCAKAPASCSPTSTRSARRDRRPSSASALRRGRGAQRRDATSPRGGGGRGAFAATAAGIRRRRHPGLQRRHRLVGADRGHRRSRSGTATWHPRRPATSWSRARRSGC